MNFAKWFTEMEQQPMVFPQRPQDYYLACVLDHPEQGSLKNFAMMHFNIPPDWFCKCHHMTVKPNCNAADFETYKDFFDKEVQIKIKALAWDDDIIAAVVASTNPHVGGTNEIPHITIAHSGRVKPFYSNKMLANLTNIKPNTAFSKPLSSQFLAVLKSNQDQVWPATKVGLARASC